MILRDAWRKSAWSKGITRTKFWVSTSTKTQTLMDVPFSLFTRHFYFIHYYRHKTILTKLISITVIPLDSQIDAYFISPHICHITTI